MYEYHAMTCGWPHFWKARDIDKILVERGCPVGKEREDALALYYSSRTKMRGARGLDRTVFKKIIGYIYWTLRLAERDEWWLFADAEETLNALRMAYDAGYTPAVKHAY